MQRIIAPARTQYNSNLSRSSVVRRAAMHISARSLKRPWLSAAQFQDANAQKRAWHKSITKQCKLRLSEVDVTEAVAFLVDSVTGIGIVSIGTIREMLIEKQNKDLKYNTVREALIRAAKKEAITIVQGKMGANRKREPNTYILRDYVYKSEDYSLETMKDLNIPSNEGIKISDPPPKPIDIDSLKDYLVDKLSKEGGTKRQTAVMLVNSYGPITVRNAYLKAIDYSPANLGGYIRKILVSDCKRLPAQMPAALSELQPEIITYYDDKGDKRIKYQ